MKRMIRVSRMLAMTALGGVMLSGGCLPPNFWATVFADTLVTGTVAAVQTRILTALGF